MNVYELFFVARDYSGLTVLITIFVIVFKYFIMLVKWIFYSPLDDKMNKEMNKEIIKRFEKIENENRYLEKTFVNVNNNYKEGIENLRKAQEQNQKEIQILTSRINIIR
jgi:Na+-translocating ferredoxin:NAD+ oxidoreductase RnfC subunit